jgi:hypothetical protein
MKLFILFGQFPNQAPVAMTVVDELTVLLSGRKEDEYKRLILDLTREQCDEPAENWAWFEVELPSDARERVRLHLMHESPKFAVKEVTPSPVQKNHPSFDGIKVTVGRTPGKLRDEDNSW